VLSIERIEFNIKEDKYTSRKRKTYIDNNPTELNNSNVSIEELNTSGDSLASSIYDPLVDNIDFDIIDSTTIPDNSSYGLLLPTNTVYYLKQSGETKKYLYKQIDTPTKESILLRKQHNIMMVLDDEFNLDELPIIPGEEGGEVEDNELLGLSTNLLGSIFIY